MSLHLYFPLSIEEREVSKATELSSSLKRRILGSKRICISEMGSSFLKFLKVRKMVGFKRSFEILQRWCIFPFLPFPLFQVFLTWPFDYSMSLLILVVHIPAVSQLVTVEIWCISEEFLQCRSKWSISMRKLNLWYFFSSKFGDKREGKEEKKSF